MVMRKTIGGPYAKDVCSPEACCCLRGASVLSLVVAKQQSQATIITPVIIGTRAIGKADCAAFRQTANVQKTKVV